MDIFYDDYVNLADDDGIVGNKTNTNLKVSEIIEMHLIMYLCT